ncbi:hypothetical protein PpBr36_02082 [Pyricularia pennisetigena]|uniref:hypothetical protein n=1 Tax=Pyricularia pennisetigena TaxID=1578925 RepID=UPI0011505DE7|nr:hypothetical protein PpBr36_02082 [Pyricularia pennisetigena]TLS29809.1 hypothetical protein PpBr36_02082 [Pyricularia pennisetigena]
MVLKQHAGLVAPACGLFLRPPRPSQRWPCSRKAQWSPVPCHLFRMLTYMTDDATMLAHRPVSESLHAILGWVDNVASYQ